MLDDLRMGDAGAPDEEFSVEEARPKAPRRGRSYPEDALAGRQMRVTDLLPSRAWVVLALCALVLLSAVGIHFGHLQRDRLQGVFGEPAYIFDVSSPGSLGQGLCVALMTGAAVTSILIYSLRRHKIDDYRGAYGIWLWVTLLLTVLSIAEYTGASGLLESLAARYAPVGLLASLPLAIHSAIALGALLFLARLGAEMQQCRLALAVMGLLLGAVGLVVALEAGWRPQGIDWPEELLAFHARLASRGLLFLMLLVYGRFTRLDALGAIQVRERKPRKKKAASGEKAPEAKSNSSQSAERDRPADSRPAAERPSQKAGDKQPEKPQEKPAEKASAAAKPQPAPVKGPVITTPKPALTLGQRVDKEDSADENGQSKRMTRQERRRLKQMGKAA